MTQTIEVHGSHGTIYADRDTGIVTGVSTKELPWQDVDAFHYFSIIEFDLVEWKKHYPDEELHESFDILDLGYSYYDKDKDVFYAEPDQFHRRMIAEDNGYFA